MLMDFVKRNSNRLNDTTSVAFLPKKDKGNAVASNDSHWISFSLNR